MEQEPLIERLRQLACGERLSHAYIIEGKNKEDQRKVAVAFAEAITPYPEDILILEPEDRSIKDQSIGNLQTRLSMKPLVGNRMVAVINAADTMTHFAQNRLLKTLEEPMGASVLLLLSENAERLLPTIRSRCVLFRLTDRTLEQGESSRKLTEQVAQIGSFLLEGKGYYRMARILDEVSTDRIEAYAFLDALEQWIGSQLIDALKSGNRNIFEPTVLSDYETARKTAHYIEEARGQLDRNANIGYALKTIVLKSLQEEE